MRVWDVNGCVEAFCIALRRATYILCLGFTFPQLQPPEPADDLKVHKHKLHPVACVAYNNEPMTETLS